jgi:hypothetical protein
VVALAQSLSTSFLLVRRSCDSWSWRTSPDGTSFTVKHIPTWMPGAGFKRHALRTRIKVRTMHDTPYEMVRKATVSHDSRTNTSHSFFVKAAGTAIPSFTSRLISDNLAAGQSPVHDEEDIKGVAGTLYGGTLLPSPDLVFRRLHFTRFTFLISCGGYGGCSSP